MFFEKSPFFRTLFDYKSRRLWFIKKTSNDYLGVWGNMAFAGEYCYLPQYKFSFTWVQRS